MAKSRPLIDPAIVEQCARLLGEAYTGSVITRLFEQAGIEDVLSSGTTKWARIYESLMARQKRDGSANAVLHFLSVSVNPARFSERTHEHVALIGDLNMILVYAGYSLKEDGRIQLVDKAMTLDEAARRVESVSRELRRRNVHPEVLRCCQREILQRDLFHGVHEATKSVFDRLRRATGRTEDGASLVDHCFGASGGNPLLVINSFATESERSEHKGFASLLKGVYGTWRNPTSHSLRVETTMVQRDVVDALSTLSYIHWRLDEAIITTTGQRV